MGLDPNNSNAAALAATLAATLNYGQPQQQQQQTIGSIYANLLGGGTGGQQSLGQQQSSSSGGRPRPPALARVSCQICRKELCNKYFLKSHLLNAHHITADDFMMNQMLNASAAASASNNTSTIDSGNQSEAGNKEASKKHAASDDSMSSEKDATDDLDTNDVNGASKSMLSSFNAALLNYNKQLLNSSEIGVGGASSELGFGNNCNMQPFLFECLDDEASSSAGELNSNFVPCMVYLPVKSKLATSVTLRVALKPLDSAIASGKSGSVEKTTDAAVESTAATTEATPVENDGEASEE